MCTSVTIGWRKLLSLTLILALPIIGAAQGRRSKSQTRTFDAIIRGGTVYDGTGRAPVRADVGIKGDRIAAVGDLKGATAPTVIEAKGLAVAPGFINMLSWSTESLIIDGRSQGEIRQGVTTQIMGEGWSMGPLNERLKQQMVARQGNVKFPIEWTTLAEYLTYLERRGVSQNVASYIGAAAPLRLPTAVMRSPLIPTSARTGARPVPS